MMKKNEIEIGGTYLAKVGARSVEVRIEGETAKGGWNAVSVASGKPVRIKDPKHLRPVKAKEGDTTAADAEAEAEQQAPADEADLVPLTQLDKEKKRGGKKAKVAKAPKVPKEKAPKKPAKEKKPKAMSCLDAAAAVLKDKGEPMRCVDMVAAMKEKGLWETNAPTPAATLYSAVLREIGKKGANARFEKTDRGHFALKNK
jgi:hypothetical protein